MKTPEMKGFEMIKILFLYYYKIVSFIFIFT